MEKVGIITSYLDFNKNYGGVLQAYALSKTVERLGYNAYIMPYIYEHIPDSKKNSIITRGKKAVYNTITPGRIDRIHQDSFRRHMLQFVNDSLPLYREERIRIEELKSISKEFYAFICGSDQVWSTVLQNNRCDPGMFLKFVGEGVKKIAYAPSTGSTTFVSKETASDIRHSLEDFNAISVRERKGQSLIKSICERDVPIVVDPTLLVEPDCWSEIEKRVKRIPEKYILVYRFGNIQYNYDCILETQKKLKLPIIELPSSAVSMNDELPKRFDIDPAEFIYLIRHATLVCTDSFHATVFSIIMSTPFLCFYRQDPLQPLNMNGRLDDLLMMTGLQERLIKIGSIINYNSLLKNDFDKAHERIDAIRGESLKYLSDALNG